MKKILFSPVMGFILFLCSVTMFAYSFNVHKKQKKYDPCEYQFIVFDDSVTVYDYGRVVGTIKSDGSLDSLIISDNE